MPRSISQFNDPIFQPPASAFYPPDFRERRISRCQPRNRNELLIARILIDFLESVKDILSSNSNDCNSVRGSFGNRGAVIALKITTRICLGIRLNFFLGEEKEFQGGTASIRCMKKRRAMERGCGKDERNGTRIKEEKERKREESLQLAEGSRERFTLRVA